MFRKFSKPFAMQTSEEQIKTQETMKAYREQAVTIYTATGYPIMKCVIWKDQNTQPTKEASPVIEHKVAKPQ